jgi:polyisoprenoid-binding protein YceI
MTTVTTDTARTTWSVDTAHTSVEFSVRHLMISSVKGRFGTVAGTVVTDPDPTQSEIDISIDAASIDTRQEQRDVHLRSADFFDVEKFPTLTYKSRRITDVRGDSFKVVGDLTIRGISREVILDVTAQGTGTDPWGGQRAGFEATASIKRSDFGLTWNQVLEAGGVAVGDDIKITIDAQVVKVQH